MDGTKTAERRTVPSRGVRRTRIGRATRVSVGRRSAGIAFWKLRLCALGGCTVRCASGGRERLRNLRPGRQRLEMDANDFRAASRFCTDAFLSRLRREFFRRQALRDERRLAAYGRRHAAPLFPKLVSAALSVRLRGVSLRGRVN